MFIQKVGIFSKYGVLCVCFVMCVCVHKHELERIRKAFCKSKLEWWLGFGYF